MSTATMSAPTVLIPATECRPRHYYNDGNYRNSSVFLGQYRDQDLWYDHGSRCLVSAWDSDQDGMDASEAAWLDHGMFAEAHRMGVSMGVL